jgi:hypothetical protein
VIRRTHIYDMDGTIVCSMHRYRTISTGSKTTIDLEYWLENEHKARNDSLLPLAEQYRRDLFDPAVFVCIATARVLHGADRAFIRKHLGIPDAIVSRAGRSDSRGGADLKINGLKRVFDKHNLWDTTKVFWEDNLTYLTKVCGALGLKGKFVPSQQGW